MFAKVIIYFFSFIFYLGTPVFGNDCNPLLSKLVEGVNYFPHPVALQIGYPICGASCFVSTLIKHGRLQRSNYHEIVRITQELGANGISRPSMIQSFNNFGFNSGFFTPANIEDLNGWAQTGATHILTWRPDYGGGQTHYSIFEGIVDGQLYYMDPNFGHRQIPVHNFLSGWADHVIWAKPR